MSAGFGQKEQEPLLQDPAAAPQAASHSLLHDIFVSGDMANTQQQLLRLLESKAVPVGERALAGAALVVDVVLRGISQVFLCNHPLTGLFISIGLALTSPFLLAHALLATALATLTASLLGAAKRDVLAGLLGYDGALVGCAAWAFLDLYWAFQATIFLAPLTAIVRLSSGKLLGAFKLPCFTLAFNIVTMSMLVAIQGNAITLSRRDTSAHHQAQMDPDLVKAMHTFNASFVLHALIKGVGQFMFVDTLPGGCLVIAGIAISSRQGALAALLGSSVGVFGAKSVISVKDLPMVREGLYGYNCAGTFVALAGGVFSNRKDWKTFAVGFLGAALCVLINVAFIGGVKPLPVLTLPFITSAWLVMASDCPHLKSEEPDVKDASGVEESASDEQKQKGESLA